MKVGDWVTYQLEGYGNNNGQGVVIGEMRYSTEKSVVILIADKNTLGMPINVKWCRTKSITDLPSAMEYRNRYEQRFPGHLKPLKFKQKPERSSVKP